MSRAKPKAEPEKGTGPSLVVSESVTLSLQKKFSDYSSSRCVPYHQTATTGDLECFIREVERKFDTDDAYDIVISDGLLSASRKTIRY